MRLAPLLLVTAALFTTGCSIKQSVSPAELSPDLAPEICAIPGIGVRAGFTTTYLQLLRDKGFNTRLLGPGSNPALCRVSTTFTGTWRWDLLLYMSYADIRVYADGAQVGHAEYDARWGGGRPDKFISAEKKIAELTNQLFPKGASGLGATSTTRAADAPLEKGAYRQQQLQKLMDEKLTYEQYQQRYRQLMED